jgi:hypothetical protein
MSSRVNDTFAALYPEMDEVQLSLRMYSLGCIAHRMRKFGFENGINFLQPRDLMGLSLCLPLANRRGLIAEAIKRGFDPDEVFKNLKTEVAANG